MNLLVTTPLHLFRLDAATGIAKLIRSGDGYYYGVSCDQDKVVLTHSGGYLQYFNGVDRPIRTIKTLIQPHQLEWIDDMVVVTNTGKNRLSIFDGSGNYCKDVFLNEILSDDKDDERIANHFNSVHRIGDKLYVVAHNYDRNSEIYVLSWPELRVLETITTKAHWAHNIWLCEWGTLVCDSKNGTLFSVTDEMAIWKTNEPDAITRGLAATNKYIIIGSSENCSRTERPWTNGCIWIVDRMALHTLDKIMLPGSGEIRDIRLIDSPDECHNGHIITHKHVAHLYRPSPVIDYAYKLRKIFPILRRDFSPISIPVRALQLLGRLDVRLKQPP